MRSRIYIAVLLVSIILFTFHQNATAHGHTEVGDYELVIGFHNEPAYQGEPNGLDLFVTNHETSEPVNGLEETLSVEIIYGSSKKELQIEPQWGQDGAYTAYVIPTETGDYTWHIFGMIEETPVDVSMTSSPDTFSPVDSKSSVSFPSAESSTAELAAQATSTSSTAQTALIVGAIGVIIGLLGLVFGLLGYRAARRPTV
jgi:hypothetical protein